MKKHIFITIISTLLLLSCGDGKEKTETVKTETVKVNNLYTVEIPAFLTKAKHLNEEASLQYQNLLKEVYIVVLDESKEAVETVIIDNGLEDYYTFDVDGYANLLTDGLESSVTFDSIPELHPKKINGLNARTMNFTGKMEGIHIYWDFAFIEGRNNYYQVMSWTLVDRKDKYKDVMSTMINSFKEIDKRKK